MATKGRKKPQPFATGRKTRGAPRLPRYDPTAQPVWEVMDEIAAMVPASEWEKIPRDLAKNLHHYLHGAPKEDE